MSNAVEAVRDVLNRGFEFYDRDGVRIRFDDHMLPGLVVQAVARSLTEDPEKRKDTVCTDCNGTGERLPDGKDSMGLPRWGDEMEDNRDKRCYTCRGLGVIVR